MASLFGGFYILTLTENSIEIKKQILNDESPFDENRLTETERKLYDIIQYNYPYDHITNKYKSRFIDSLKIANPGVLQAAYFVQLFKKATNYPNPQKVYTVKKINITKDDFNHLVAIINNSGYWKMPYDLKCEYPPTDGFGYGLEANTKYKYNFVTAVSCSDSSDQIIKFAKSCQEIVNYAHMEKEIFIWSDNMYKTDTAMVIQDVQLEDIKEPQQNIKRKNLICRKKIQLYK